MEQDPKDWPASTIRAVDLPEVRAEMVNFLFDHGQAMFRRFIDVGLMPVRPMVHPDESARVLAGQEAKRLTGDLFYVSAEMAELATVAAISLPPFILMPEDLPTKSGLMLFERPIKVMEQGPDHYRKNVYIIAVAWGPWNPGPGAKAWSGIWVSWYSDPRLMDPEKFAPGMPRLMYDNEYQIPFSLKPLKTANPFTGQKTDDEVGDYPIDVIRTAWLLMQQPLARIEEIQPDRASRKRIQRMQQEPGPVRVIKLRRTHAPTGSGEADREYHHQWVVRGHWRQQWFPSVQAHRPVWIAPHIKGPEGAPLLGGEKVHAWMR